MSYLVTFLSYIVLVMSGLVAAVFSINTFFRPKPDGRVEFKAPIHFPPEIDEPYTASTFLQTATSLVVATTIHVLHGPTAPAGPLALWVYFFGITVTSLDLARKAASRVIGYTENLTPRAEKEGKVRQFIDSQLNTVISFSCLLVCQGVLGKSWLAAMGYIAGKS